MTAKKTEKSICSSSGCGSGSGRHSRRATSALWLFAALLLVRGSLRLKAQPQDDIDDITGKYHFLSPDDTLAILEEEGKLKGYVDVYQSEEESDAILSYPITLGLRTKNHVEFKTAKIHEKYYRFTGAAERGSGHEAGDPDYLRLVGDLEVVTLKGAAGEESVERRRAVFKSIGKNERPADDDQDK
ncbi:MAG TPA: hypothetical protein VG204_07300 [Terriglobia bacterium]|nr:hypothetical protein [Terriglobia bacterium]